MQSRLFPSRTTKMPEAKPIASTSAALDPHKPTPTPGDAKSPFGAKATRLPCGSEDEDEREADEDGVAPVKKGKEGEGKRPTPVPIPDQRLENNFIASIRNYVQPIDAGEGESRRNQSMSTEID